MTPCWIYDYLRSLAHRSPNSVDRRTLPFPFSFAPDARIECLFLQSGHCLPRIPGDRENSTAALYLVEGLGPFLFLPHAAERARANRPAFPASQQDQRFDRADITNEAQTGSPLVCR